MLLQSCDEFLLTLWLPQQLLSHCGHGSIGSAFGQTDLSSWPGCGWATGPKGAEGVVVVWRTHTKVKREAVDIECNYKSRSTVARPSSQCQDIATRVSPTVAKELEKSLKNSLFKSVE
ncbi:hypothetical protein ACLKA6_005012 [Drosophila palustris]